MKGLSHRERVLIALNHEAPDRVPLDLGGRVATLTDGAYQRLKDHLGISGGIERINNEYTVDVIDERIMELFDTDFRRVFIGGPQPKIAADGSFVNQWGVLQKKVGQRFGSYVGHYSEFASTPLRNASIEDVENYPWPDPYDPRRVEGLKEKAEHLFHHTDYAISAATPCGGLLEYGMFLCGFDQFPVDLMLNKEFAGKLIEKVYEVQRGLFEVYLDAVGSYIQMIEMHDDYGMQTGLLISPALYREIIKPYHVKLIQLIRSKTSAKIFHHTCGAVVDIVDELIDSGVDVLNPVQPNPKGMGDPNALKKRFGARICFHGGIDEQHVLPHGNVADVRREVEKRIRGLAPGGGYILAAAHNVQVDTPPENVVAMFEAAKELGRYPIGS